MPYLLLKRVGVSFLELLNMKVTKLMLTVRLALPLTMNYSLSLTGTFNGYKILLNNYSALPNLHFKGLFQPFPRLLFGSLCNYRKVNHMKSYLLQQDSDIQVMRDMIARLPDGNTVMDFDEAMLLSQVRASVRLWQADVQTIAFAYVDENRNLMFVADPAFSSPELEAEIVEWGADAVRKRNAETGESNTLDASCNAKNATRMAFLERHRFVREDVRSLGYERPFSLPIPAHSLPEGFILRSALGEEEVEDLVALHRAAFGTENMTVEYRLAIMRSPQYIPDLDLIAVAPNGELAAFCICGFDDDDAEVGYTDPIGTHARYQKLGLGKAMVSAGLNALKARDAKKATTGTASYNVAMQRLAEVMGFKVVSEGLWFSRKVD